MNLIKFRCAIQIVMADNHNVETVLTDGFFQLIKKVGNIYCSIAKVILKNLSTVSVTI